MSEDARVGVFVCHCGTNIGGCVDVPKVVEYAKTLPNVVFATSNLYTCAEDGLSSIRESIKEQNLNRVVVAACTPRTHAPLFQTTCEDAGLNKYLFTFVNIREQCSWVHMKEKDSATEKAKELIRMGVARVELLQPQEEVQINVIPSAVVIGGGVAGMAAAISLADQGFPVRLVEKEKELGGFVRNLGYIWQERKEAVGALSSMIRRVKNHRNISLYLDSQLVSVDGFIGNYEIVIDTHGEQKKDKVGVIVVATGALEYIPEGLYGYEQYDNVITLTEFEILAKNKKLPKLSSIAFIQCVGLEGTGQVLLFQDMLQRHPEERHEPGGQLEEHARAGGSRQGSREHSGGEGHPCRDNRKEAGPYGTKGPRGW